ncbi:hypothetical protein JQ615_11930 [Bradyrhizobium jicamae]|uniref:Uncharacterized protein n=1 Tax=Bradyrhizobium jicamae TaxID=280332 RepID=A0ABS5FH44_9BRAD|nr:hypothetical protein [Bradyrhizobium jicamae]MBR0796099.1 hypothetical protein [Bradyrhizobium jicamae]MBR0935714.1 hypothetical protein [Bradyrhizobium jicamae]
MHGYTAYVLSPDDRILWRMDLFCGSDDDAREQAQSLAAGKPVELWDGARKVGKFAPSKALN